MKRIVSIIAAIVLFIVLIVVILDGGDEENNACKPTGGSSSSAGQGPSTAVNAEGLAYPVPADVELGSPFGMRDGSMHNGQDLPAERGTPIYAFADGVVIDAKDTGVNGFGGWVVMKHDFDGEEYTTVYGHMEPGQVHVATGDQVKAGEHIADMGSAGQSSGPHLHFEVHKGNRLENGYGGVEDPRPWLDKAREGAGEAPAEDTSDSADDADTDADSDSDTDADSDTTSADPSATADGDTDADASVNGGEATKELRAKQIIDVGQQRGADDDTIVAALASALVESDLRNLASEAVPESKEYPNDGVDPGDHDSVGLFQQRASLWAEQAGGMEGLMDPKQQINWWYDHKEEINAQGSPGEIAAQVENPDERFRGRYAERTPEAEELYDKLKDGASGSMDSTVDDCFNIGDGDGPGTGAGTDVGEAIVEAARREEGHMYVWGGGDHNGPTMGLDNSGDENGKPGYDCSGLVMYAVAKGAGVKLRAHHTNEQILDPQLEPVDWEDRQVGDILYFGNGNELHHASIYSGEKDGKPMQVEAQSFGVPVGEYPVRDEPQVEVRRVKVPDNAADQDKDKDSKDKDSKDAADGADKPDEDNKDD